MTPRQAAGTTPERDGDTEARILTAARHVFVRRGTAGARMQEIAEEAGVNQALLHYYFRSKDRLAATVFRELAGRLIPAVLALLGSDAPIEEKVESFVALYIDTVRDTPFVPGYVLSELHHHPERLAAIAAEAGANPRAVVAPMLARLRAQLDERIAAGTMRPIAPEQFLASMLGLVAIPFVARPMMGAVLEMDDAAFSRFLDVRRAELPGFILSALRP